jgi:hypothetical protein
VDAQLFRRQFQQQTLLPTKIVFHVYSTLFLALVKYHVHTMFDNHVVFWKLLKFATFLPLDLHHMAVWNLHEVQALLA